MPNKQDSNSSGLRYAEEVIGTLGTLIASPIWYPLEPNSYADFGGEVSVVARNPISEGRQRKKGVITDLDASGGFNTDLSQFNLTRLLQGAFFANIREKDTTEPMNGTAIPLTGVTTGPETYTAASGLDAFGADDLVFVSGCSTAANNGLKTVTAAAASVLTVSETLTAEASPPAAAKIERVGIEGAAGDIDVLMSGSIATLTSTALDFTTLGLIVGEWIWIGGDNATNQFAGATNSGFARVSIIAANVLTLDKTPGGTMVTEASTTEEIHLYFGNMLKNEPLAANIIRRSYQFERTLGDDGVAVQSEYIIGSMINEVTFNIATADKLTTDLTLVSTDHEQRTGTVGVKAGTRPSIAVATAFNTSSDVTHKKLYTLDAADSNPTPLFAFLKELTLTISNNVTPDKAVGVLGAFDVSVGTFEIGGSMTAYFADVAAVTAVRNNANVTFDFSLVKENAGFLFDVPLLALGNGRLAVEQDQSIQLPLDVMAAESALGNTLTMMIFPYLPTLAEA